MLIIHFKPEAERESVEVDGDGPLAVLHSMSEEDREQVAAIVVPPVEIEPDDEAPDVHERHTPPVEDIGQWYADRAAEVEAASEEE